MGECPPSSTYIYDELGGRSTLTIEFWDEGYPYAEEPPRVNITAQDHEHNYAATAGLDYEQVRALHDALTRWLTPPEVPS